MSYHIKYGNLLYLAYGNVWQWTHDTREADYFTMEGAQIRILDLKQDTGLYEARIVAESDTAIIVENVP